MADFEQKTTGDSSASRSFPEYSPATSAGTTMYETCVQFLMFYKTSALQFWNTLRPMEYGIMLSMVGVIGWWMMRFKKGL